MNTLQRRLVSAGAVAALLLNTLTPAFAATTLEITGNANDDNTVSLNQTNTTSVSQNNNASVNNVITATANSGDNQANRNAGGDVSVDTGDASVDVSVTNDLNHNAADVDRCNGCGVGDATVKISGNTNDDNTADLDVTNKTVVTQDNDADVFNKVYSSSNTGDNETNRNAGGNVDVTTGDASTKTTVETAANSNTLRMGGGNGDGTLSAMIMNNSNDDNTLTLGVDASTWVAQSNDADVTNIVSTDSNTGDNEAYRNAGGSVSIDTGDADTTVEVANALNSNSARVMGGDSNSSVDAVISGNANEDDNTINLDLGLTTTLFQNNSADVLNWVTADADTGDNDANRNAGGNVEIETGDATVDVAVDTMSNFNYADVECDCLFDSVLAKIAGNTNDDNTIRATLDDGLFVNQGNCGEYQTKGLSRIWFPFHDCATNNILGAHADSGDNEAYRNGGSVHGDPSVSTGDVDVNVDSSTSGNANVYGTTGDIEFPFPEGSGVNLNITIDLQDLLNWIAGHNA